MARATTELWSLGGIPMSVERDSEDTPIVRMGELGPLDSSRTILHYGGTESYNRDLTAVMWNYSGYVNEFMPLIGTGYHTLTSDDGSQGDYFILSCKPERLHDFIQCSGNSPVRMNIKLKKDNEQPPIPTIDGKYVVVGASAASTASMVYTADVDATPVVYTAIGATPLTEAVIDFVFDPDNENRLVALTDPGGGSTVGNLYTISDYTDPAESWTLINDGATTYAAVVSAHGDCSLGRKLQMATGNKVLFNVVASNRWLSIYGNVSACSTLGTIVPGGNNRSALRCMVSAGGAFYAGGTSNFSIWIDSVYWSSSNGGTWTLQGSIGSGTAYGNFTLGLLGTDDGDVLCFTWTGQDWMRFPGGALGGASVIANGWGNGYWAGFGEPAGQDWMQLDVGDGTDSWFLVGTDPPVGYGTSYLYKNNEWNSVWNSASITSKCTTCDNFRGAPDSIAPEDRIILGGTSDGVSGTNDRLVWLMTDAGATISNKTGNLKSTHGFSYLRKVLFDQVK